MVSQNKDSDDNGSGEELSKVIKTQIYCEGKIPSTQQENKRSSAVKAQVSITKLDPDAKVFFYN